jgi:hypothetical protein
MELLERSVIFSFETPPIHSIETPLSNEGRQILHIDDHQSVFAAFTQVASVSITHIPDHEVFIRRFGWVPTAAPVAQWSQEPKIHMLHLYEWLESTILFS